MSTIRSKVPFAVSALVLVAGACSGNDRAREPEPMSFVAPDAAGSDACGLRQCSPDLRRVLEGCSGAVLEECGPDQGCGGGACVPACEAASSSKGSIGCDFFTLPPDDTTNTSTAADSCLTAFIANTWDGPVQVSAEYGSDPLDITRSTFLAPAGQDALVPLNGPLPPGQVALIFLSSAWQSPADARVPGCPGSAAITHDPISHGTGQTKAFRLKTDRPVSAYSLFPFGGATSYISSATLLLPTSAWSTNTLAVSPWPVTHQVAAFGDAQFLARPFLQIVAAENDTEVRMRPNVDIVANGNFPRVPASTTHAWKLNAGEVLQITQVEELSGTAIESDKPIGYFSGHECAPIPNNQTNACDVLDQQIPALSLWGNEYALVPPLPRRPGEQTVPYRILAAVDGTTLTYDSLYPPTDDAPKTLNAGEAATFLSRQPMVIHSQDAAHPIYAAVYMTGATFEARSPGSVLRGDGDDEEGDPDYVNLVASQQFLDRYVFYVDYSYANSSLTVVRQKGPSGFVPVTLDCAGEVVGWQPIGTAGAYEMAFVPLTIATLDQTYGTGRCGSGRHEAKSTQPFGVYVWGTDLYASYGYPGGAGLRPLTEIKASVPR